MRNLVVFLLLTLTITAYAQFRPIDKEIAEAKLRDGINEKNHVIGIGTAPNVSTSLINPKQLAREAAIEHVYVEVAANVRAILHASKDEPFHEDVAEHYSTVAQMPVVPITLPRIKRVRLDRPIADNHTYAVVAYNRQEIIDFYTKKAEKLRKEINKTLAEGLGGSTETAAAQYLGTYRQYEELKEAELIIVGTEYKPNAKAAFEKLLNYMETEGSQEETIDFLEAYFQNVSPLVIKGRESVAKALTMQIAMQIPPSSSTKIQLDEFTYGTTEATTGFAPILAEDMKIQMTGMWMPVPQTGGNSYGLGSVDARLIGTYWERGNKVTVRAALRDANTGEFQAVAIFRFNKNALIDDVRHDMYKPYNYEAITREQMLIAQAKLGGNIGSSGPATGGSGGGLVPPTTTAGGTPTPTTTTPTTTAGGTPTPTTTTPTTTPVVASTEPVIRNDSFRLQIKTDKGHGSQTYTIGERMRLYVMVNQPASLRIAYQQNGKWSQLADDQTIEPELVSQWLEIPGNFVCAEPEGIGQILVAAKTEPFDPITDFYYEDGYRYIGKRPAAPGTVTPEQRDAENVEVQYLLRGFINKNYKENVATANPKIRGLINIDPTFKDKQPGPTTPNPTDTPTTTIMDNSTVGSHVGTALEALYLTTVRKE